MMRITACGPDMLPAALPDVECRASGPVNRSSRGRSKRAQLRGTPACLPRRLVHLPTLCHPRPTMSWLPVIATELDAFEHALGVAVPKSYRDLLLDPRVQALLSHPRLGVLPPGTHMDAFVEATRFFRSQQPGFPPDGVLATMPGPGRYVRFWRPDPRHPGILGGQLFSWDTQDHRAIKDCSSLTWVHGALRLMEQHEPEAFARAGFPLPRGRTSAPILRVHPCDAFPTTLLPDAWIPLTHLDVQGQTLLVCDVGALPLKAVHHAIPVVPGRHAVLVRLAKVGGHQRVAAVRVVREGARSFTARAVGAVDVDHAGLVILDLDMFQRRIPSRRRAEFLDDLLEVPLLPSLVVAGRDAHAFLTPSGRGDGSHPLFELRDTAGVVGLEVQCVL